jgi:hypothetical protein
MGARPLSQLIVGMYPEHILTSINTREKGDVNQYLYCLMVDRVYPVYTNLYTDEHDHRTISTA